MYVLVWHAKEPLLLNGHECRVKICSHSPVMVTTPYELIIQEWDQKKPQNKQTNKRNTTKNYSVNQFTSDSKFQGDNIQQF